MTGDIRLDSCSGGTGFNERRHSDPVNLNWLQCIIAEVAVAAHCSEGPDCEEG